ncbi:MAG TPA: DoxX family membrane protein [Stellaceae bacterium]|nr:DoxX family membrane protein [Stellaceae bacterium]
MRASGNAAALLGRVAISVIFVIGGWAKLLSPAATQGNFAGPSPAAGAGGLGRGRRG